MAALVLAGPLSGQTLTHYVGDFFWVTDPLSNEYTLDPAVDVTLTASEVGTLGGSTTGQTLGFNGGGWLFFGDNTSGVSDMSSITYTFEFTAPVVDFTFDLSGISNNVSWSEVYTNFSSTPVVTDISNALWDGTTLSTDVFGGANLRFEGPVTSVSFDWIGSGFNAGSLIPNNTMSWTAVPEPSKSALVLVGAIMVILVRHRL